MVLEDTLNPRADPHLLRRITQQVAHETHTTGMGQFHQYDEVRTALFQCRMHRVPYTLPAVDLSLRGHLDPVGIKRVTAVA